MNLPVFLAVTQRILDSLTQSYVLMGDKLPSVRVATLETGDSLFSF